MNVDWQILPTSKHSRCSEKSLLHVILWEAKLNAFLLGPARILTGWFYTSVYRSCVFLSALRGKDWIPLLSKRGKNTTLLCHIYTWISYSKINSRGTIWETPGIPPDMKFLEKKNHFLQYFKQFFLQYCSYSKKENIK